MPNNDRVSVARRSYMVGLNRADRIGFERGSKGEPHDPNPYKRPDYAQCYEQGWRRGSNWRISRLRGKAKSKAIIEHTAQVFAPALRRLADR